MDTSSLSLRVEGDPNEVDSFAACAAASAKSWGEAADYEYVAGLAGMAFSPVLDQGEECTAWWMEGGDDVRIEFIGQALGFESQAVSRDLDFSEEVKEQYLTTGELPPEIETYMEKLRTSLDSNKMVIMRTWPSWSVLTGWNEDVTQLPFSTVPGLEPLCANIWGPHKSRLAYILTPGAPVLEKADAIIEALRFGAEIATGTFATDNIRYGGTLYEAAAAKMGDEHFCSICKENDVICAHRTLRRMHSCPRSAIVFLQAARTILRNGSRHSYLENAFKRYQEMSAICSQYRESETFKASWSDSGFRNSLAIDLNRLKSLHDAAAQELVGFAANVGTQS